MPGKIETARTMENRECYPFPENFEVEVEFQLTRRVENWMIDCVIILHISFKHQSEQAQPTCEKYIVKGWKPVCKEDLA
jgi:hypothetical protein